MTNRIRADLLLVERGFYESRARAQSAISAGLVLVDGVVIQKSSSTIAPNAEIIATAEHPWVSRGGVKLAAALDEFGIDPSDQFCLDIGASTGGFTDVLLHRQARHVVAVDVGHDQFHKGLSGNRRVTLIEGTDARTLQSSNFTELPSILVVDVSFISLSLVLPPVLALGLSKAKLVALIKPQFEVGRANLKKGIVKDEIARNETINRIERQLTVLGWPVLGVMPSPIAGGDGNIEFLIAAEKRD